jgi:hypothetical protein
VTTSRLIPHQGLLSPRSDKEIAAQTARATKQANLPVAVPGSEHSLCDQWPSARQQISGDAPLYLAISTNQTIAAFATVPLMPAPVAMV